MEPVNTRNGSYELYDVQKGQLSAGVGSGQGNRPVGLTPGSPLTSNQILLNLQKELSERKLREDQLLQIISELRSSQSQNISGTFNDSPFLNAEGASGSPSNESLGENVKDAHIKHLRRQVTILQANLYKTEGWSLRHDSVLKERDQAIDELASVTSGLSQAQEENAGLRQELNKVKSGFLELQHKLRLISEELEEERKHHQCQGHVAKLEEEIVDQNGRIKTLQDSLGRLSLENKTMRESSSTNPISQSSSMNSMACSQELEYLHRVVDTLKTTVLEQRNFLVNLKSPHPLQGGNVSQNGTGSVVSGVKNAQYPKPRVSQGPVSEVAVPVPAVGDGSHRYVTAQVGGVPQHSHLLHEQVLGQNAQGGVGQVTEGASVRPLNMNHSPLKQALSIGHTSRSGSTNTCTPSSSSQDVSEVFNLKYRPGVPNELVKELGKQREVVRPVDYPRPLKLASNSKTMQGHESNDEYVMLAPHRTSQSEVIREKSTLPQQNSSASETFARLPIREPKSYPQWMFNSRSGEMITSTPSPNARSSPDNTFQTEMQGMLFEGSDVPPGQLAKFGNSQKPSGAAVGNQQATISSTSQIPQHVYCSPPLYTLGSPQIMNSDLLLGGGQVTVRSSELAHSQPEQHLERRDRYALPAGPRGDQSQSNNPPTCTRPVAEAQAVNLNSDRLCPVCNADFAHLNMEDFQTHVFECFDDENAPETMVADRACPMCDIKFQPDAPQDDYEKHVHSHFGEERPGDNFEILAPP